MAYRGSDRKMVRLSCESGELEQKLRNFLDAEGYHVVTGFAGSASPGPTATGGHGEIQVKASEPEGLIADPGMDFEIESEFSKE